MFKLYIAEPTKQGLLSHSKKCNKHFNWH